MNPDQNRNRTNDEADEDLSSLLTPTGLTRLSSKNPLLIIKKNLFKNMVWAVIICSMYLFIILYFNVWQIRTIFSIILILSLWTLFKTYKEYKKIHTDISPIDPLLTELKRHQQSITRWMHAQQRAWILIYPFCAAGGFFLGGMLGPGNTLETFMQKPLAIPTLIITIIVLVPAGYFLARRLFKASFGNHLNALQENIKDMENEY